MSASCDSRRSFRASSIIAQLGAHNVIGAPLREELKGLGPTRFSEFAQAVRAWLEKTAG